MDRESGWQAAAGAECEDVTSIIRKGKREREMEEEQGRGQKRRPTKAQLILLAGSYGITKIDGKVLSRLTNAKIADAVKAAMWAEENATDDRSEMSKQEMALIRKACLSNYDIPDKELGRTPAVLIRIIESSRATQRTRIAAARTLVELRRFTLEQVKTMLRIDDESLAGDDTVRAVRTPLSGPSL